MSEDEGGPGPLTFEEFRRSFYYGSRTDMQFKYLARMSDEDAADAITAILKALGEAFDTGDWESVRRAAFLAQVAGYEPPEPVEPEFDDAPFQPLDGPLSRVDLALVSAGGVFHPDADPMGPDGPSQEEVPPRIQEFLKGTPSLTEIPGDVRVEELSARHPGYDALSAQRDPNTVFPLEPLRELERDGRVRLAPTHYTFVGATSQLRLRDRVAPEWAQRLKEAQVGAALLVAT
ncbi:MAG: glycine/sarcosine/betaine reductase selenoprotein B family protein [Nitriliruptorales bacterium]